MNDLERRISALEAQAGMQARTHFVFETAGLDVKAAIADLIARGVAKADDRFLSFSWSSAPERPMSPDPFRSWPSRDAPPPANDP